MCGRSHFGRDKPCLTLIALVTITEGSVKVGKISPRRHEEENVAIRRNQIISQRNAEPEQSSQESKLRTDIPGQVL